MHVFAIIVAEIVQNEVKRKPFTDISQNPFTGFVCGNVCRQLSGNNVIFF